MEVSTRTTLLNSSFRFNSGRTRLFCLFSAVVEEGAENFLFVRNGKKFERVSVHIEYRDPQSVVIAEQRGGLCRGSGRCQGAHQLQLALSNKSGGAIDPHAGHNLNPGSNSDHAQFHYSTRASLPSPDDCLGTRTYGLWWL